MYNNVNPQGSEVVMKVSIVFPIHNQAALLQKPIQSILNQTLQDFELIIVDNGSTDETSHVLSKIQDPRVRIIHQEKQSNASALNNGFANAKGEYWTWTSVDNTFTPNWLAELVDALDSYSVDVGCALSYCAITDNHGNILYINKEQRFDIPSLLMQEIKNTSFLYRSTLAKKVGSYDTFLQYAEDDDMWVRMASSTSAALIDKVLCHHRMNTHQIDVSEKNKIKEANKAIVDKFLLRTRGRFVLDYIFPCINVNKNAEFERFKARLRLATLGMDTHKYCPTDSIVDQLIQALEQSYDEKLIGNIVHLYAKDNRWNDALMVVEAYLKTHPSSFLEQLKTIILKNDISELNKIPFLTMDESHLGNDCESKRTQKEILRNLASAQSKLAEENTGFFAQIVTELVHGLEDNQDHPEIWKALSEFTTAKDQLKLAQLKSYLGALLRVPQDPRVSTYLKILEGVCCAFTGNKESGKSKLEEVVNNDPTLATAKGALEFISQ